MRNYGEMSDKVLCCPFHASAQRQMCTHPIVNIYYPWYIAGMDCVPAAVYMYMYCSRSILHRILYYSVL